MPRNAAVYTTMSLNAGYAARRHRDQGNRGPSIAIFLGDFVGGELKVWKGDAGSGPVENLIEAEALVYNTKLAAVVFDGKKAHKVAVKGSQWCFFQHQPTKQRRPC